MLLVLDVRGTPADVDGDGHVDATSGSSGMPRSDRLIELFEQAMAVKGSAQTASRRDDSFFSRTNARSST